MNIDPKQAICGLRPALLKRIFRRQTFTSGKFARSAKLKWSEVTTKLEELAAERWIIRHPHRANEWATSVKGDRLAATSLTAPITVAMARELAREAVAAAEAMDADITRFYAVERLVLFGGGLAGPSDEKVRDVDLGYEIGSREPKLRLVTHSISDPAASDPLVHWGEIPRRLKAHGKVSLVDLRNRDPGDAIVLYRWDRDAGRSETTLPW